MPVAQLGVRARRRARHQRTGDAESTVARGSRARRRDCRAGVDLGYTKNWDQDVRAFDAVYDHILHMSDALSDGIVKQFPEKLGGAAATTPARWSASGCTFVRDRRQPETLVRRVIDAERELINRVELRDQFIAPLEERRAVDDVVVHLGQQ